MTLSPSGPNQDGILTIGIFSLECPAKESPPDPRSLLSPDHRIITQWLAIGYPLVYQNKANGFQNDYGLVCL